MAKKKKKRKSGFSTGFKRTKLPLDSGYVKGRKDGSRAHKRTPRGKVHIDRKDPKKDPIGHLVQDVLGIKPKKRRRKRKKSR